MILYVKVAVFLQYQKDVKVCYDNVMEDLSVG